MFEATPPVSAKRRVLVVEDDAIVASGLVASLEELGISVTWCSGVEDAIVAIHGGNDFEVAIIDYNLNGVASIPVLSALADLHIPTVLCTGYDVSSIDGRFQALPRIEKPFTRKAIRNLMTETS